MLHRLWFYGHVAWVYYFYRWVFFTVYLNCKVREILLLLTSVYGMCKVCRITVCYVELCRYEQVVQGAYSEKREVCRGNICYIGCGFMDMWRGVFKPGNRQQAELIFSIPVK